MTKIKKPAKAVDDVLRVAAVLKQARLDDERIQHGAFDAHHSGDDRGKTYYDEASFFSFDRIQAARWGLSLAEAKTLEGAAVQLVEALNELDTLDSITQPLEGETAFEVARSTRTIQRLLWSAFAAVEAKCSITVGEIVDADYISRHTNPLVPVADRLATLAEEESKPTRDGVGRIIRQQRKDASNG